VRLDVCTKLVWLQAGPDEAAGQAGEERRFVERNTHRPPGLATAFGDEADGATTPTDGDESASSALRASTRTRTECHASASRRLTLSCGATTKSFSTPWVPSAFPIPSGERRADRRLGATVMNTSFWLVDLDRVHSSYLFVVTLAGLGLAANALYGIGLIGQSLRVLGPVVRAGIRGAFRIPDRPGRRHLRGAVGPPEGARPPVPLLRWRP
jgi:hypothetical protein